MKAFVGPKDDLVVNAGLSVSGLQHVGRLRGEISLAQFLTRSLAGAGRTVLQSLVLYTQDEWKGKPGQLAAFRGDEGAKYVGRRLIDVPDPGGCHASWVDHYWQDFGGVLERFAPGVRIVSTTEAYRNPEMKAIVHDLVSRAEQVRGVVNKYRSRRPYPSGWIPFEAFCDACGTIGARTLSVVGEAVEYECERCGVRGRSSIENGKLNWRLEWPALWKTYRVDVEPFGKDHATPGGSRDSCKEIAETVLHFRPPMGIPYEWVGLSDRGKDLGDMGSSDFVGFTPAQWVEVGDPEVLRYLYAFNPIARRVVLDLARVDAYHDLYDSAEAACYNRASEGDEANFARSYELAQIVPAPEQAPFRLSYRHAAYLSQVGPTTDRLAWTFRRLRDTGMLTRDLSVWERDRVDRRLRQACAWVETYSPENRVALLDVLTPSVRSQLDATDREALREFAARAKGISWTEDALKESMVGLTKAGILPVDTPRFFRDLYLVLLGTERGPRAAPFLAVLPKDWVLSRLQDGAS